MTRDRETRRAHPPDFDADDDDAFDVPGAPSALDAFVAEGWISEVLHEVKSGKDATVYCCRAQPRAGVDLVAAKVYRSRHLRTFKNDAIYRKGRVIGEKRVRRAVERKTAFGREAQFGLWVGHEWATLSLLHAAGARLTVADVDVDNVARAVKEFGADTVEPAKAHAVACDIFAPCALGAVVNDDTLPELKCRVVGGSANNQLENEEHGEALQQMGILYAPDYVINAGGLINVADELRGYDRNRAMAKVEGVYRTLREVFLVSRERGISTAQAADAMAQSRIDRVSRLRRYWVPGRSTAGPRAVW